MKLERWRAELEGRGMRISRSNICVPALMGMVGKV